jgi:hypothetical protein
MEALRFVRRQAKRLSVEYFRRIQLARLLLGERRLHLVAQPVASTQGGAVRERAATMLEALAAPA